MQSLPSPELLQAADALPIRVPRHVPLGRALLAQAAACAVVLVASMAIPAEVGLRTYPLAWAIMQGIAAATFGVLFRMPAWWVPMHLLFVPALWLALSLHVEPGYALSTFIALALLYGGVARSRVPLFLSSRAAVQALAELLPRDARFVDLGCGPGGVLASLQRMRPDCRYEGVESAPVPFLLAGLRAAFGAGSIRVTWGDMDRIDLGRYDAVYAYLSPAAMDSLWRKARLEMRPGSLLISNSFGIPGVVPHRRVHAGPGTSPLLVWTM